MAVRQFQTCTHTEISSRDEDAAKRPTPKNFISAPGRWDTKPPCQKGCCRETRVQNHTKRDWFVQDRRSISIMMHDLSYTFCTNALYSLFVPGAPCLWAFKQLQIVVGVRESKQISFFCYFSRNLHITETCSSSKSREPMWSKGFTILETKTIIHPGQVKQTTNITNSAASSPADGFSSQSCCFIRTTLDPGVIMLSSSQLWKKNSWIHLEVS